MQGPRFQSSKARGAAVIAAMTVVAISAILAAQVFERQQLAVRSIENRMDASQILWIERAASDWARLILWLDARTTAIDHLGEPWAMMVQQTELDPTVYGGARAGTKDASAVLTGRIEDAQSRFNLGNLLDKGKVSVSDVVALRRLLGVIGLDAGLAEEIAGFAVATGFGRIRDLLSVRGIDLGSFERLERYVVVLPRRSAVNVNSSSAELLYAYLPGLDLTAAQALIKRREKEAFKDLATLRARLPEYVHLPAEHFAVTTRFFMMEGVILYGRVSSRARILFERNPQPDQDLEAVSVVWRERL